MCLLNVCQEQSLGLAILLNFLTLARLDKLDHNNHILNIFRLDGTDRQKLYSQTVFTDKKWIYLEQAVCSMK